jgi:uncharacterized membrane protein YkgB
MISTIFIIGMIYFYSVADKSIVVKQYKSSLSKELQQRYEKISKERMNISYQGYALGVIISLGIIFYNLKIKSVKINNSSLVCIVVATSFITNYFYYMLSPKSDWMLSHMNNEKEIKSWFSMYREMQFNYHMGLVLGIIAVGILAFAFRC